MVVEKDFYKRIRLFWWVALGVFLFGILQNVLLKTGFKVLNDFGDKGIEPSESQVNYVKFLVEHERTFAYIGIAVSLIFFGALLLLSKYSKGLLVAAIIGFAMATLNFIEVFFYWNKPSYTPGVLIIEYVVLAAALVRMVIYAASMRNLIKPFSESTAKLWKVLLWLMVGDIILRVSSAVLTVVLVKKQSDPPAVVRTLGTIGNYYVSARSLYEIVLLGLTVLMLKKLMEQQKAAAEEMLPEETVE